MVLDDDDDDGCEGRDHDGSETHLDVRKTRFHQQHHPTNCRAGLGPCIIFLLSSPTEYFGVAKGHLIFVLRMFLKVKRSCRINKTHPLK